MKVLIDHQAFDMQTHGGVSRCFTELAFHMPIDVETRVSVLETNNAYLLEKGWNEKGTFYHKFVRLGEFPCKGRLFGWYCKYIIQTDYWNNYNRDNSINLLKNGEFDIFHPTFFDDYFLHFLNGKPFVLTIHDMIPELYPQYFNRDDKQILMKQKLAPLASAIIAVSERTKKDVVKILGVEPDKVHVIYHGAPENTIKISNISPLSFPYILYVGDRNSYKNFVPFVKECAKVLRDRTDLKVVCTGKPFIESEVALFEAEGVSKRFIQKFIQTDSELQTLYHYAKVFVYPSEYEGFGIPILEAYQADCPVLLNNASCFPELAQDAAVFFNLNNEGSNLREAINRILDMDDFEREALLIKQRQRLSAFSWEKSAKQLSEVYKAIIK